MSYGQDYMRRLAVLLGSLDEAQFAAAVSLLGRTGEAGGKVMLAGNGASAAMASHIAVDLTKVAGVRGVAFNDADLITCFANDYGYEHWMARAVRAYGRPGDALMLISSSGRSPSVLNAAAEATEMGLPIVTLSGFAPDNPLRASGTVNLWVDDHRYNMVEATHQAWLVAMVDALAGIPIEPADAHVAHGVVR